MISRLDHIEESCTLRPKRSELAGSHLSDAVTDAAMQAARFLLARQDSDGGWRDFLCKPGRSEAWVTAYIGARLLPLLRVPALRSLAPTLEAALVGASELLRRIADDRGGWGYNRNTAIDADSTAHAVLFLTALGVPVSLRSYSTLASFQLQDGSFATYSPGGPPSGWACGHPDVTAVAARALSQILKPDHVILRNGIVSLERHLKGAQPATSYWWPSPFYLPLQLRRIRHLTPKGFDSLAEEPLTDGFFDEALALQSAVLSLPLPRSRRGVEAASIVSRARSLCLSQAADGSWAVQPILRITSPRAFTVAEAGSLQASVIPDDRRLYTTATVMEALVSALHFAATAG